MSISLLPEFDADGYQVEPSTEKINEIITAVNESGGGGGDTYPMHQAVWYDNATAMAGVPTEGGMGMDPDTVYGGLIRVSDPASAISGVGVRVMSGPSGEAATIRIALFAVAETGTSRGLPGAKVADLGTIALSDAETGWKTLVTNVPVDPGCYWIGIATTASIELMAWATTTTGSARLGVLSPDGGNFGFAGGVEVASAGAQTAMPATLVGVVDAGDRVSEAPQVFFQVTPT